MSSSRLKPSVTPVTALATRLRARPWNFATDTCFDGLAARHDTARGRQDAGAEAGEHFRHVIASEIDAAARPADALDTGNQFLAVRPVFQEQPQRLDRRDTFRRARDLV